MKSIAERAKTTLNVTTEICILKTKAFKTMTGSVQRGGTYNYFQDRVLINQNVAQLRTLPHLEWTIFHEYGHAYFARTFARNSFFPMIVHAPWVEDELIENEIGRAHV
jgi:Zn-dependent peptidase ImmA (M78 family)